MKKTAWIATMAFPYVLMAQTGTAQDVLIDKLHKVNLNLAASDPAKIGVMLRLADLYAERARLDSMKELEAGCVECHAGKSDREKALRLYQEALAKADSQQKAKILVQMGHLQELLGQEKAAIHSYESVLSVSGQGSMAAEAYLALAEIHFKKGRFTEARNYYNKVLENPGASSKGFAAYRKAWSDFNLGHFAEAVEGTKRILKTPELQNRSQGTATGQADVSFLEEVSRDLATFLSRKSFTAGEVEEIFNLSPATTRMQNVVLLANELARTGKKAEATQVWTFAYERMAEPALKLEALVQLAPLKFDEKNTDESLRMMDSALQLWTELNGCGRNDCSEFQKVLRGLVVNWNQTEKKNPSENLQKAYQIYGKVFPEDTQMLLWGAEVAKHRKDWPAAQQFLVSTLNHQKTNAKPAELETTLLIYLEVAEMSQSQEMWKAAADTYLASSPTQSKAFEVRYQMAKQAYDQGQYEVALTGLKEIADNNKAPANLRVQAAHLSLDALGLLKDETRLQEWSSGFATRFPAQAKEFKDISQKALLTQSAKLATSDTEAAWQVLSRFDGAQASPEDRQIYLKNKILLAEKTKRWVLASQSVDEYLTIPTLSAEDREFALSKKAWYAELRLDFTTALKTLEKMSAPQMKPDQKLLKLAMYADLAGVNSKAYYQNFLNQTQETELKVDIATQLVRKSENPFAEITKHMSILKSRPEVLARLYAEAYIKDPSQKNLKAILADKTIESSAFAKALWRVQFIDQLKPLSDKIAKGQIDSSTQKALARTIKTRATDLENLEKMAAQAIDKADWSGQVLSLSILSRESNRFYEELLSLPIPQGLTPEQESEYMNLLGQQAAPYKNKSEQAQAKLTEFWSSSWQEPLQKSMTDAETFRPLIEKEVMALKEVATGDHLTFLAGITVPTAAKDEKPAPQLVEAARNEVREAPFDKARLEKLLEIEKQAKNYAMVQYLESRIRQTEKEVQP